MERTLYDLTPIKELIKTKALEEVDALASIDTTYATLRISVQDIIKEYIDSLGIVDPTWYITAVAYAKMNLLVHTHSEEIGWYGTVERHPNNQFIINDIIVYPQHVSGATCEQDESKMFEFETSLTDKQVNARRFQGHSHVNMGTTPSGVDETFYKQLLEHVTDYFMVAVVNKSGSIYTRFYDVEHNIIYTDVPIWVIDESGVCIDKWVEEQLEEKITERPASALVRRYGYSGKQIYDEQPTLYWDPKTKKNMTAQEYKDKYKRYPKGYRKQKIQQKQKSSTMSPQELKEIMRGDPDYFYDDFKL